MFTILLTLLILDALLLSVVVLLQDALDGGGTDNITILVGRTIRRRVDH